MNKLTFLLPILLIFTSNCFSQENTSKKKFENIALVNKITFFEAKFDQPKFSCGFLLKLNGDTFAVTAKHLLKIIKTADMKMLNFDNQIKSWSLFPLDKPTETVTCNKLLNENKSESLTAKSTYDNDWLVFSISQNSTQIKPLEIRTSPLVQGEKIYAIGWTRTMENGPQRVYEFEYHKTIGNRILLKELIVPEKFGGLSGAPVVDENGLIVGIVSGATADPETDQKYFSPCSITGLVSFLEKIKN